MAVQFEGKSYIVETPLNNAYSILNHINTKLTENDVRDSEGNLVQFQINLTSPMWLLCLGVGYIASVLQKLIYAVGSAFSIADCSEQQVLNLAQIAKLKRKQGSYTTVDATVFADSSGCSITTDLTATASYDGATYTFHPAYNENIDGESNARIVLVCETIGPVYLPANTITTFVSVPAGFDHMTSEAAQPGTDIESINSLRTRLQANTSIIPYEGCLQAIAGLTGVVKCNMFFNPNYSQTLEAAGYHIPPRHTILFVQGYSESIAETYLSYMTALTTDDTANGNTPEEQQYTMSNGQVFSVYYYPPEAIPIMVRISISEPSVDAITSDNIKNAVVALSNTKQIGENYSDAYIIDSINPNSNFPMITGCQVSTDGGTSWSETTNFTIAQLGVITKENVLVGE